jgi:hypothetical protein
LLIWFGLWLFATQGCLKILVGRLKPSHLDVLATTNLMILAMEPYRQVAASAARLRIVPNPTRRRTPFAHSVRLYWTHFSPGSSEGIGHFSPPLQQKAIAGLMGLALDPARRTRAARARERWSRRAHELSLQKYHAVSLMSSYFSL